MATPIEEINKLFEQLSPDSQQRVLEYAQGLAQTQRAILSLPKTPLPPGTSGAALLSTLQSIKMLPEDIEAMERALEDCERIDPDASR